MSTAAAPVSSRARLAAVALGEEPADAVIVGGKIVDVYSGAIRPADIAIADSRIAAVGDVEALIGPKTIVHDLSGSILVPGMIDTHLHLIGCQLPVAELSRQLVAAGTAAVSACYYEAGVVGGRPAMDWMLDEARESDLRILLSPFFSCYRGLGSFGNPGRVSADEFLSLLDDPATVEIREWNVYMERLGDPVLTEFAERARERGLIIAGHLEGMSGRELQASVAVGASSDHEAVTAQEALERIELGVQVQIREGTAARNFDEVIKAITEHGADPRFFMFCTDGQDAHDTARSGHIGALVAKAIRAGVPAVDAVRMGSLNAAEYLRMDHELGSLTPGRRAFVTAVDSLESFTVQDVIVGTERVVADGVARAAQQFRAIPDQFRDTIRVAGPLTAADMAITAPGVDQVTARVIGIDPGVLITREQVRPFPVVDGIVAPPVDGDVVTMAVIDRHEHSGRIALGLLQGSGIERGAIATTTSPALMNLMALGRNVEDLALAANRVSELGGGVVAVLDGEVLAEVALPVLGVFSDRPFEEVAAGLSEFDRVVSERLGSNFPGLTTVAGFAMMPVSIPGLKLCDRGLVRVGRDGSELVELLLEAP